MTARRRRGTQVPLRPLFKQVGGKRRLAPAIVDFFPPRRFRRYVEPFFGGGAVFAALWNAGRIDESVAVVINDGCRPISTALAAVAHEPDALLGELAYFSDVYRRDPRAVYFCERDLWNDNPRARTAARFLFLKHTAFNGLWRENSTGGMNSAWGERREFPVPTEQVYAWSAALANAAFFARNLAERDLNAIAPDLGAGDAVYADPPYVGTFSSYVAGGFDDAAQQSLLRTLEQASRRGAFTAYSNSLSALSLARKHWPHAMCGRLETRYLVNRDGAGRALVQELFAVADGASLVL